ncbi:prolipoprotein diacylglyceryl transferase [Brevibacterium antiquum]|uniref:Phosphatidylglycerol--prolipoprotein diacylglyceryl transferase n=1 Tax=Brevibacterium antiquum CNRZ 918 TaxID=1255637 RepID=A0A2H1ID99_9MICO|nr:prolipoprotein diacylglyceryl transferase [Brevibacterium antiquum]SMX73163.1 prolipoprotein diacylglyceryl transferase [Brevibacterium antiquum CNRZ 918]
MLANPAVEILPTSSVDVLASIPSPSVSSFQLGPLTIHFYALCILTGIVLAIILTNRHLTKRGVPEWQVLDIATLAVPMAIIGARIYHVITHYTDYFGPGRNPWNIFEPGSVWAIWEGGIAIFGSLIGGTLGALIMCRRLNIKLSALLDALAPGLILAQACGRFGNWFNQELFGLPTTLPWGLEIDPSNANFPAGLPADTLFHPTFLYEVVWNSLGCLALLWLGRHLFFQWGRLFGMYLIWYGAGRIVWESIRLDPSFVVLGLRTNVWAAIGAVALGLAIIIVQKMRHPEPEESPFIPGREAVRTD